VLDRPPEPPVEPVEPVEPESESEHPAVANTRASAREESTDFMESTSSVNLS
jgi:hypothetical protein